MSVSPIIVELTSTRSLLSTPSKSVNKERSRQPPIAIALYWARG
ncbi:MULTISPECIES: hypothetical protein [Kamptonema]|nr:MULTISPECIES: hypothetical protein [Kamptonema]